MRSRIPDPRSSRAHRIDWIGASPLPPATRSTGPRWPSRRYETPSGPETLTHGDYRLDNLLFPPDGGRVGVVDWQTLGIGPAVGDASYFLDRLDAGKDSEVSVIEAAHATEVLLAGYLSASKGEAVKLPLPGEK